MSVRVDSKLLVAEARIVPAPVQRACEDRTFGLPWGLHAAYFGLFLTYLGVMAVGFPHPEMVLPMAVFVVFTAAFYIVPMLWAVMKPDHGSRAISMAQLMARGISVETGHSSGGAAVAQVLVLPVLILFWGLAVVTIAALV
jgi:hypothetical protein